MEEEFLTRLINEDDDMKSFEDDSDSSDMDSDDDDSWADPDNPEE